MKNKNIENLSKRYCAIFGSEPVDKAEIHKIESSLGLLLPDDFNEISNFYSGGLLGNVSFFTINADPYDDFGLVNRTLYYRTCDLKLPHKYVALSENEVSFVVLETQENVHRNARVIECSISDAYCLSSGLQMQDDPTIYDNFSIYFESLLKKEEMYGSE